MMTTNTLTESSLKATIDSLRGAKPELLAKLRDAIGEEYDRQAAELILALEHVKASSGGKAKRARKAKTNGATVNGPTAPYARIG